MKTQIKKSKIVLIIMCLILISVLIIAGKPRTTSAPTAKDESSGGQLAGIQLTLAPWKAEVDHLKERLDAIGLPALKQEGSALHIHQHLNIVIMGHMVPVPAGIGINEESQFIASIHTHDDSGVIHVESPTAQNFTLGQFFDIWGVRFTSSCIGGYCNEGTRTLKVYVNGTLFPADVDARSIELKEHQEIVVVYGNPKEEPTVIPSSYAFSEEE